MSNRLVVVLFAVLLSSIRPALANQLVAGNASAISGGDATIAVSLASGQLPLGGDFTITFDSTRLSFVDVFAAAPDFLPFAAPVGGPGNLLLSLLYLGDPDLIPSQATGPLFSLLFTVSASLADGDVAAIDIAGCGYDASFACVPLPASISPTVTVTHSVPEPGVAGLLGIAFCALAALFRRRRRVVS